MSPCPGVLNEPARSRLAGSAILPVLIQVPTLAPTHSRRYARVRPARLRPRAVASAPRRRRRIRREVRLAGSVVLFSVPMAWILLGLWVPRPFADAAATSPTAVATAEPDAPEAVPAPAPAPAPVPEPVASGLSRPWVSISLEPVPTGLPERIEGPVVLPAGYLLPDPSAEEPAHAGG